MTTATLVVMAGDGIGPEIVREAVKVLRRIERVFGHQFVLEDRLIGGAAIDAYGCPLRAADLDDCKRADAVLFGAVGGPKWDGIDVALRPERGLLALRKGMGLFANLRPVTIHPSLVDSSPLKPQLLDDVDLVIVRELTGGVYFGKPSGERVSKQGRSAVDTMRYRDSEIERIVRLAFELARSRNRKLTSVDKANVLATSRLWREVVNEIATAFPDVALEHTYVDAMSMQLIRQPGHYDVVVTENMFGDILTDEASIVAGSIGMLPSASVGNARSQQDPRRRGVYEPIHGSAPAIAGKGAANPSGTILSLAMLLRQSLGLETEAVAVEAAVANTVCDEIRTPDIAGSLTPVSTATFGDAVAARISV